MVPLIVTFCDKAYVPVLANWLAAARAVGDYEVCVYGLDDETCAFAETAGVGATRLDWDGQFGSLWVTRIEVLLDLLSQGRAVVHTDVDCVWLRDPLADTLTDRADITFSQGTIHPPTCFREFGFVLCCGLFRVQPTPHAVAFLGRVRDHVRTSGDDQTSVNEVLGAQGIEWADTAQPDYRLRFRKERFSCWTRPRSGRCTGDPLTAELVPHGAVQRVHDPLHPDPVALHFMTPKEAGPKLEALEQVGLLAIRPDWRDVPSGSAFSAYLER